MHMCETERGGIEAEIVEDGKRGKESSSEVSDLLYSLCGTSSKIFLY